MSDSLSWLLVFVVRMTQLILTTFRKNQLRKFKGSLILKAKAESSVKIKSRRKQNVLYIKTKKAVPGRNSLFYIITFD